MTTTTFKDSFTYDYYLGRMTYESWNLKAHLNLKIFRASLPEIASALYSWIWCVQRKDGEEEGSEEQHCSSDRGASNLLGALLTKRLVARHKNLSVVRLNCFHVSLPLYLVMHSIQMDFWQKWYHFHRQN